MAVNKVVYNRRTLIDLTADTVSKETLKKGFTAHQADGTMITGEFIGDDYDESTSELNVSLHPDGLVKDTSATESSSSAK